MYTHIIAKNLYFYSVSHTQGQSRTEHSYSTIHIHWIETFRRETQRNLLSSDFSRIFLNWNRGMFVVIDWQYGKLVCDKWRFSTWWTGGAILISAATHDGGSDGAELIGGGGRTGGRKSSWLTSSWLSGRRKGKILTSSSGFSQVHLLKKCWQCHFLPNSRNLYL